MEKWSDNIMYISEMIDWMKVDLKSMAERKPTVVNETHPNALWAATVVHNWKSDEVEIIFLYNAV